MAHPDVALAISQMRIAMTLPLEKGGNKKARRSENVNENVNETDGGWRITSNKNENGKNKHKTTRRAKIKKNRQNQERSQQTKKKQHALCNATELHSNSNSHEAY